MVGWLTIKTNLCFQNQVCAHVVHFGKLNVRLLNGLATGDTTQSNGEKSKVIKVINLYFTCLYACVFIYFVSDAVNCYILLYKYPYYYYYNYVRFSMRRHIFNFLTDCCNCWGSIIQSWSTVSSSSEHQDLPGDLFTSQAFPSVRRPERKSRFWGSKNLCFEFLIINEFYLRLVDVNYHKNTVWNKVKM